MQAHNNNIEEFLSVPRTVFVVPVYQRNYDWLDANCNQLFQDILKSIELKKEHFLGTICFKSYSAHERSIIDGQQRLTSITLLLKALYDLVEDEVVKSEISETYFFNRGHSVDNIYLKTKLHLNKRDDAVYHILLENDKDTVESKLTSAQKETRIYQNYLLFSEHIRKYLDDGKNVDEFLECLRRLTIIELEVQEENPQEIFESLNSTGLDLTNVDLLRNFFLMQFGYEEQTKLYEEYWYQIENIIGVDNMEQFFVDYLVFRKRTDAININMRRSHITERTLYYAFKNFYSNLSIDSKYERTVYCLNDLKECAELYKSFIFKSDVVIEKENKLRQKLYFLLTVNDSNKARSLLLYIYDCFKRKLISENMLEQVVDVVSSLTFRARICKAQGINRQFAGNVMQRMDESIKAGGIGDEQFLDLFWKAITAGKGSYAFPTDMEFRDALVHKDMYLTLKSKGAKYLLYMLEMNSPRPKGLPAFDDESISIEHIMPQTLDEKWKAYLGGESLQDYEIYLHRLGNLTLTNYNSELSNKSFDEKREIYKESKFYYATKLSDVSKWGMAEVNKRSELLAVEAMKIWPYPEKYKKDKAAHESLHMLDEDFAQYHYTKPSYLVVDDEEFVVSSWSDFIPTICNKLKQENIEIFKEIAMPEVISAFSRDDEMHTYSENAAYVEVIHGIFCRMAKSASSTLGTVTKIVKQFDKKAGTDYTNSIMFSIR